MNFSVDKKRTPNLSSSYNNRAPDTNINKLATIIACIAVSTVLGSVHAFSVFIPGWESITGNSRAAISFVYSLALISLTVAVLLGHRVYSRCSAQQIFLLVGAGAFIGLWTCAHSANIAIIYLTFGCVFGFANGLGYGYTLQLAGQTAVKHHAISMSLVTAFYAVGAALASQYFHSLTQKAGIAYALQMGGSIIAIVCIAASIVCSITRTSLHLERKTTHARKSGTRKLKINLWLLYGCSVTAGLMVIGHALPIYTSRHPDALHVALAPTIVATGNIVGGLCIGLTTLVLSNRMLLLWFALFSLSGLLLVSQQFFTLPVITLLGLTLIGFSYGATIAVFPIVVSDLFGKLSAPKVYGQIFTAWGLAGLLAPTVSGLLYDLMGSYSLSTGIALLACALSIKLIPPNLK